VFGTHERNGTIGFSSGFSAVLDSLLNSTLVASGARGMDGPTAGWLNSGYFGALLVQVSVDHIDLWTPGRA